MKARTRVTERSIIVGQQRVASRPYIHVHMDIDQAGRHVHSLGVHAFLGLLRRDVFRNARNPVAHNRNVHDAVDVVRGVDDVSALDQQVIGLLGAQRAQQGKEAQRCRDVRTK
jgi:hypothetical protein